MLSSISWQHYLAAVVIITVSYYLYVVLRYYQKEISVLFNRKTQTDFFSVVRPPAISVMGQAKPDNGVSIDETQNLPFTDVFPDDPNHAITESNHIAGSQNDPGSELVSEVGNLIEAFKDVDNKQEFITLVGILVGSYKKSQEQIDLPAALSRVVEISKDKLKFTVAVSDFKNSWA